MVGPWPGVAGDLRREAGGRHEYATRVIRHCDCDPGELRQASIDQFRLGRIAAPIVIELGLGYWDKHLRADYKKLMDSKIQHGYLVHLSRMPSARRMCTEKLINGMQNVQVVYVHHDIPNKRVFYKALDGKLITEEDYSPE